MMSIPYHRHYLSNSFKTASLFLMVFLFLIECDSSIDKKKNDRKQTGDTGAVSKMTAPYTNDGYKTILLPKAIVHKVVNNRMRIDEEGYIYGSISKNNYSPGKAVRWKTDSLGNITGPIFMGDLPEPYDDADQTIQYANSKGVAVGYADKDQVVRIGMVFLNGKLKKLPEPDANHRGYAAYDINEKGVIVGQAYIIIDDGKSVSYGMAWFPPYDKKPLLLPRVEKYDINAARAINEEGVVTGGLRCSGYKDVGVRWRLDTQGNVLSGPDIIENSEGIFMTDANETLDFSGLGEGIGSPRLYRSDIDQLLDLPNPNDKLRSFAYSINDRALDGSVEIVGLTDIGYIHATNAVYWKVSAEGTVYGPINLVLPKISNKTPPQLQRSFVSSGAYSINNQGWIVGWSKRDDGTMIGTLWLPKLEGSLDISYFSLMKSR